MALRVCGTRHTVAFSSSILPSLSQTPVAPAQMLRAFKLHATTSRLRNFSQQITVTTRASVSNPEPQLPSPNLVRYAYYVPRNSRGSLPVYSDIRNNGTRILVLIRNVEGNIEQLAKDLTQALREKGSPNAARMRVAVKPRQLVLQGGFWKNDVMEWLIAKGF